MNIIINNYCNLKCRYCFANDFLNRPSQRAMDMETFEEILAWNKKNNITEIKLIGGEPTIHPLFKEFIIKIAEDRFFQKIHIFSNCTFDKSTLDFLIKYKKSINITILPNINERKVIGEANWKVTLFNLEHLQKNNIIDIIGINLYEPNMSFTYIFNIANKIGIRNIRWSVTIPNESLDKDFDYGAYMKPFIPLLTSFYKEAIKHGIGLVRDCNSLPICLLSEELVRYIAMVVPQDLMPHSCDCTPVLDVDHNMDVFRCFAFSESTHANLKDFDKMTDLYNFFQRSYEKLEHKPLLGECIKCPKYRYHGNKSCGCMKYRMKFSDTESNWIS